MYRLGPMSTRYRHPIISSTRYLISNNYCSKTAPNPLETQKSIAQNVSIATRQQLYTIDASSPGSVFFMPHGTRIFNRLMTFMRHQQIRYGFEEVITPLIFKNELWEKSGHWQNYKEDMFQVEGNEQRDDDKQKQKYGLKPMNCPGHCVLYSKIEHSYNELPIRYSDFSSLHRNEASGALTGLTRVRRFHQDDGHIFCQLDQIEDEIANNIKLIKETYSVFGLENVEYKLSTRPDKYMGDLQTWNDAESKLTHVLKSTGENWSIREGDGAFYGPKIDILITDAHGKQHQIGTIQLDFQLPQRFDLYYVDKQGSRSQRPIMVHRAVFGSLERFFAILLDHYQGNWPFWLSPRHAIVIPVKDDNIEHAQTIVNTLKGKISTTDGISPICGHNFWVDLDSRSTTVGARIKDAISKGYSYIVMVGDRDIANGTIAVRTRDSKKVENVPVQELYRQFIELETNYK